MATLFLSGLETSGTAMSGTKAAVSPSDSVARQLQTQSGSSASTAPFEEREKTRATGELAEDMGGGASTLLSSQAGTGQGESEKPARAQEQEAEHTGAIRSRSVDRTATISMPDDDTETDGGTRTARASRDGSNPRQPFLLRRLSPVPNSLSDWALQNRPQTPIVPAAREKSPDTIRRSSAAGYRDSTISHHSTTSSSVYPASTASDEDSLNSPNSARTPKETFPSDAQPNEVPNFDGDDVSYRLRLLVKNNYFLPPAHAKPSLPNATPVKASGSKSTTKSTSPGFLDIFRRGRSKSRPATPVAMPQAHREHSAAPVLRTTADSTTASGWIPRPHSRSLPVIPTNQPVDANRSGRVVVVREKVDDLLVAAQQAEAGIKARADGDQDITPRNRHEHVDPTDSVDMPPPGPGYPFAVQASAVHGLGIGDSVDASALVNALCPPLSSPALWSLDSKEEEWRKALLHQAVGLSLGNSPTTSVSGGSSATPSPLPSPGLSHGSVSSVSAPKLGQRIIDQALIECDEEACEPYLKPQKSKGVLSGPKSGPSGRDNSPNPKASGSRLSPHVYTSQEPSARSLPPPPRKLVVNPLYSLSQTDLSTNAVTPPTSGSAHTVRKASSTPILSEAHEAELRARSSSAAMPSSVPENTRMSLSSPVLMQDLRDAESSFRDRATVDGASMRTFSSEDRQGETRYATPIGVEESDHRSPSRLLAPADDRPSLSDIFRRSVSPATSAFKSALLDGRRTPSPLPRSIADPDLTPRSSFDSARRGPSGLKIIPPSRDPSPSTKPVTPPPRSSSLSRRSRPRVSPVSPASSQFSISTTPDESEDMEPIMAPPPSTPPLPGPVLSPTTPPLPGSNDRRTYPTLPSLRIPGETVAPGLRSAPTASSQIGFFDEFEGQSDLLDDLDDSEDESENEFGVLSDMQSESVYLDANTQPASTRTSIASSRPSVMGLGNPSLPSFAPSVRSLPANRVSTPTFDPSDERRKPVGNVVNRPSPRRSIFSRKKKHKGIGSASPLDFRSTDARPSFGSESIATASFDSERLSIATEEQLPSAESNSGTAARNQSIHEFDSLLSKHLEAEKVVMQRITGSVPRKKKPWDEK